MHPLSNGWFAPQFTLTLPLGFMAAALKRVQGGDLDVTVTVGPDNRLDFAGSAVLMTFSLIFSAASRYFSMSSGETESTSPMLSKP